jgi:hypothetical protein
VRRPVAAFLPCDSSPNAAGQVRPPESADKSDKSAHSKTLAASLVGFESRRDSDSPRRLAGCHAGLDVPSFSP